MLGSRGYSMELAKVASSSFVLIDADWPASRVLGLIEQLVPSRLIVRRNGTPDTYYLLKPGIAKRQLEQAEPGAPVAQSLDWTKLAAVPLLDGSDEEDSYSGS